MPTALPTPEQLLSRPGSERLREFKYRFGQSVVFGLPVIALQLWGRSLGPADSDRWVSLLQALLCGWVVYINLGMLVEGLLAARLCLRGDFTVASAAVVLYVYSLVSALCGIITSRLWYPLAFHICVIVLSAWTGYRWWRLSRLTTNN